MSALRSPEQKKGDVTALAAGALFATGLVVSGMARASKIVAFLDVAGTWDPSLLFVMVGALVVYGVLSRTVMRRRAAPLFDEKFHVPPGNPVDARIVAGAAVFGLGWGIGGFCPGPALVATGTGALGPVVFVAAMTIGMLLYRPPRPPRAK